MLGSEQDPSIDDLRGRLERSPERLADGKGAEFVIADARTDEFVGAVNLFALDWHSRRGEVGIWLRQRARGRGLASAALALMLDWVFDSLELERVEMTTIPDNEQPLQRAIRGRGAYVTFVRRPGVVPLLLAGTAVGLSGTMAPVSLVLFARHATRSFALASIVLAADTAGNILVAPARGRLLDRRGPKTALLGLGILGAITDGAFIAAGVTHAPAVVLAALSIVSGAATAPVGAAMRNAWSDVNPEPSGRAIAYATLTISSQVTFIGGPLLAGAALAFASATAAVVLAAALDLLGAIGFLVVAARLGLFREPAPQPAPTRASTSRTSTIRVAGVRVAAGAAAGFGLSFGVLDVALPGFGQRHATPALGGILLATLAVGIALGGFLYGLRNSLRSAARDYPPLAALAALGLIPTIFATSGATLLLAVLLGGVCFAPITARQFAVIDEVVSREQRSEALSWMGSAYGALSAAGAVVSGQLIDLSGTQLAFMAAVAGTGLAALTATLGRKHLSPQRLRQPESRTS